VWTRNFELDSLAYFLMYLWNYWASPGLYRPEALLLEPLVHDAVVTVLKVLEIEQHHEERSPYRYSELPRDGLGPPTKYTGGVWQAWPCCQHVVHLHITWRHLCGAKRCIRVTLAGCHEYPGRVGTG
jgi:meiotically up-regulated gene 157 (Mug157) protein